MWAEMWEKPKPKLERRLKDLQLKFDWLVGEFYDIGENKFRSPPEEDTNWFSTARNRSTKTPMVAENWIIVEWEKP